MGTSITIRNVPDETHAELTARAARAGQSLQEYLRGELVRLSQKPDIDVLLDRVRERVNRTDTRLPAERILEHRDADRR